MVYSLVHQRIPMTSAVDANTLPLKTDAEIEHGIKAARGRFRLIDKIMNPFVLGAILVSCLAVPMLLLAQPASIVVALAATATTAVGLGVAKGSAQYKEKLKASTYYDEHLARQEDPARRGKALGEVFRAALNGGVKEDIKVKKPLQLKKALTP